MNRPDAAAVGVGIAVGLLPLPFPGLVVRLCLVIAVVKGLFVAVGELRGPEVRWMLALGGFLAGSVPSVVFASAQGVALADFGRQTFAVAFSVLLVFVLRSPDARRALTSSALIPAVLGGGLILALFLQYGGSSGFSLLAFRAFKFRVRDAMDVDLNPISFGIVFAALLAWPAYARRPVRGFAVALAVAAATLIAGSRTTTAAVMAAFALFVLWKVVRRSPLAVRGLVYAGMALLLWLAVRWVARLTQDPIGDLALAEISSGRWPLWRAAWEKFLEQPLVGWGALSWHEGILNYLPAVRPELLAQILTLGSGGFHNAYLTLLAEKGLFALLPALVALGYLLHLSIEIHDRRAELELPDRRLAAIAPLMTFLIIVRNVGEVGGLIGYANGAVDYLEFAMASLVVAVAADRPQPRGSTQQSPQGALPS